MTASRTRSRTTRGLGAALGVTLGAGLVLVTGCTSSGTEDPGPGPAVPAGGFRLVAYDSCEDAERELREAAHEYMGPWGFGSLGAELAVTDGGALEGGDAAAAPGAPAAPEAARGAPGAGATAPGFSGTNVHEQGVDEPDVIKTDGRRIVTVSGGVLRVVDAARRVETGALDLREAVADSTGDGLTEDELVEFAYQPADLLLHGDRALVLMPHGWYGGLPRPAEPGPATGRSGESAPAGSPLPAPITGPRLLLVDLTGAPRVASQYTVDGSLVDSRAVGATARVVVRSQPRLDLPALAGDATQEERLAANRDAVRAAGLEQWLPRFQVSAAGAESQTGQVDCTALHRPAGYAENGTGTSLLTVLTFDLSAPALGTGEPVSVAADGDTVYSNGPSLYVTSDRRWQIQPGNPEALQAAEGRTEIYKFDTSGSGAPRYTAAGAVDGWLINQYAMSEWEGHLRVATTRQAPFWGPTDGEDTPSESTVYALSEQDGELVVTGSVSGLGKGERIYSVRFTGPVGYVVTFRETDPLYTLDLRDPAAPAVLGELKITGYSAYLHPLGDGRLVGVGQEADEQGRPLGTQVSLFDVSDLANPTRLAQHHVAQGHSEAEFDPHAFLWWPAQRLLVIPLYAPEGSGALALRVGEDQLTERELISHPRDTTLGSDIRRSLVIGDTLWTLSNAGLQANALATLATTAWLPF